MEDIPAGGGTAGLLEEALALAGKGRLNDAARTRLWALAAGGAIAPETAHALVALDTEARGKEAKDPQAPATLEASRREEIRLAWAHAVPWSLRGRMELPLATWAVLGMLIARAQFAHESWRAELSLTEQQRRLGGAGRKTVAGAVARLEERGLVRAIRRKRNPRFNEVNVYVLEHPEAMRAASETSWREDGPPDAGEAVERPEARAGASQAVTGPPQAPGVGERPPAPPAGIQGGRERPSRTPAQEVHDVAKPSAPGESPRAAPGIPEPAGGSPVSNSSPWETHSHPEKESTTELQWNDPASENRPPSPHPLKPGTATPPSCSRQQGHKRRGPPPAGPPAARKPPPEPLPEPVARGLARIAAAELGEDAETSTAGGSPKACSRAAWRNSTARPGRRPGPGTGRERRWR